VNSLFYHPCFCGKIILHRGFFDAMMGMVYFAPKRTALKPFVLGVFRWWQPVVIFSSYQFLHINSVYKLSEFCLQAIGSCVCRQHQVWHSQNNAQSALNIGLQQRRNPIPLIPITLLQK